MAQTVRILFVDDEPAIRASLPAVLRMHGFEVTSTASVGEAVQALAAQPFDVLISDLNIGSPGDGFTVVSAMRRTQPSCVTFILTGYPAFETALQAIRSQVDDYLIKPAGVQELVECIESKLRNRSPHQLERLKRVPQILKENATEIAGRIHLAESRILVQPCMNLTEDECRRGTESFVCQVAAQMTSGSPQLLPEVAEWSRRHGRSRYQHGYSAAMLVEESRIACAVMLDCIHSNLLIADVSLLIPDLKSLSDTMASILREAVAAYSTITRAA